MPDSLRAAFGRLDRTVEVECDPPQATFGDSFQNQFPQQFAKLPDRTLVRLSQHPTDRGHMGEVAKSEQSLHQRIVTIIRYIPQFTKPQ